MDREVLELLAEHLDELVDQLDQLVAQGQYLWFRPSDSTFQVTSTRNGGDGWYYLLDASPAWVAQWNGDLAVAADSLVDALITVMEG
ncbi:hypothetical protein [Mycolicibacterium vaccae]|uniref:hypothetical protein n=1 Tax=Mycolicibacterium vaccae TaxID=1810 RepID=UPI003D04DDE0